LLELGFLGFLTFAAGFIRFFVMALTRIVSVAEKPEDYWPMQMLVLIVIVNFSEARLLTPSWNWLMYVTTSLSLTLSFQRTPIFEEEFRSQNSGVRINQSGIQARD
jgi:O-antigen ligase